MHDTFQLLKVGTRDRHISKTFLGVYAGDRVPKRQQMPCCYIINTDNSGEPGKHWIAIFEKSITDLGQNIFFDSYGIVPSQLNPLWKNNTSTSHILIAKVVKAGKYTIKKHVPLKTVSFFVSTAMNPHPQGQLGVSANTEDLNRGDLRLQVTCRDYSKLVMTWNCFKNLT